MWTTYHALVYRYFLEDLLTSMLCCSSPALLCTIGESADLPQNQRYYHLDAPLLTRIQTRIMQEDVSSYYQLYRL